MVTFPSHTTHLLQPLDVGVYAMFKKYFRQELRKLQGVELDFGEKDPSQASIRRAKNLVAAVEALHLSCSPLQINKSFKYSGLYPWDVNQTLRNPRINPSEKITINNRKRKGIQMDGIVVTAQSFIEYQ